jgi:hypothetical protein
MKDWTGAATLALPALLLRERAIFVFALSVVCGFFRTRAGAPEMRARRRTRQTPYGYTYADCSPSGSPRAQNPSRNSVQITMKVAV